MAKEDTVDREAARREELLTMGAFEGTIGHPLVHLRCPGFWNKFEAFCSGLGRACIVAGSVVGIRYGYQRLNSSKTIDVPVDAPVLEIATNE